MENNNSKDQWIDEALNSTNGMRKAQPGNGLYDKVIGNLSRPAVRKQVTRWAAAAILLLALNIGSVLYNKNRNSSTPQSSENPIAAEMQAETTYNYQAQ
jgi:negative regulator of sigma E activity